MSLLFRILCFILILLAFIIILIGFIYILLCELDWIFEVDLLWKVKEKVRVIVYGNQPGIYNKKRLKNSNKISINKIGALKRNYKQYNERKCN